MKQPFNLQEGEKIVKEIKPVPAYKWYLFIPSFLLSLFTIGFMAMPIFFVAGQLLLWIPLALLLGITFFPYAYAMLRYSKQNYWITNKRVIYMRGLIGYTINSIPLDRISDVTISRSFFESLLGFGSVMIQSLAGQIAYNRRMGAEGSLTAVSNPEGLQKEIFELVSKHRKKEKLSF
ncbi:MAG: PH domain-containing protein [Nanoarchaeota archaeon]|nr:PH domain-containing protein [Nanoarchaeota archaeon]